MERLEITVGCSKSLDVDAGLPTDDDTRQDVKTRMSAYFIAVHIHELLIVL